MSRPVFLLCVVAFFSFCAGLGRAAISDSDEAFYAEAAREMVESGDWITPRYNYEVRFQKPILYYWLAAACYLLAGVNEAAARLPSVLSGVGLTILSWAVGRRWYNERVGLIAGLITASNFGYFALARLALPDLPLAFFIALATWAAFEAMSASDRVPAGSKGRGTAREWLGLAAVGSALGFLTKGPVAVALPAIVIGAALLLERRRVPDRRLIPVAAGDLALASLLFAALTLPWYIAMVDVHGPAYLHRFFVGENLERFATDRYNEPRSFFFYVPIVLGGLLPWSSLVALWVPAWARTLRGMQRPAPVEWRLLLWAAVPLLFYTVSVGKQPRYVLPVLPPLAVALAATLASRLDRPTARRALAWCATASAVVFLISGSLLFGIGPLIGSANSSWTDAAPGLIIAAGLALVLVAWLGPLRLLPGAMVATSVMSFLSAYFFLYSSSGEEPVQRAAAVVRRERSSVSESGTYRVFVRNLVFYARARQHNLEDDDEAVEYLNRQDRVLCVLRADDLDRLRPRLAVTPRQLLEINYFNPAGIRLRSLLAPDPDSDSERIVVVVNR